MIERGSKIPKWKDATQKWKQDREYVKKYNPENLPEVLVNRVITKIFSDEIILNYNIFLYLWKNVYIFS